LIFKKKEMSKKVREEEEEEEDISLPNSKIRFAFSFEK
jgi:hypothetical protein